MKTANDRDFNLDAQQGKALNLVLKGKNVFVTGKSGTGKTELVRAIERFCP